MKTGSNIGEIGPKSIRIGGMKLDQLPIAEAVYAKDQLPDVMKTEVQNKIEIILAKYPRSTSAYLKSRIVECNDNIVRVAKLKDEQDDMISNYSSHISMCSYRDEEISKLDAIKNKLEIRALQLQFPPYSIAAMEQQIQQCKDSKTRCDGVIEQEHTSIAELIQVLALVDQRDLELHQYGVKVA